MSILEQIQPQIDAFLEDPIQYIITHIKYLVVNHGREFRKESHIPWSCIIQPDDVDIIQELIGGEFSREGSLPWRVTLQYLEDVLEPEKFLDNSDLKNMDYEYLDQCMDKLTIDWKDVGYLYYIPEWFYQKYNLDDKFDDVQKIIWHLIPIMKEVVNNQRRSQSLAKKAI